MLISVINAAKNAFEATAAPNANTTNDHCITFAQQVGHRVFGETWLAVVQNADQNKIKKGAGSV